MAVTDDQLLHLNPWWTDPAAIERDAKLRELGRHKLAWNPPVMEAIELVPGRLHTLRGPRQVGKSTTIKRLIRRLLERGERRVLYFSFELSTDHADIVSAIQRARQLHPDPSGAWYVFLDEVTMMRDWQLGVKYVVDHGPSDADLLLCTGSSARKVGSEQLPGRKGKGRHYLQMPLSFRDFCNAAIGLPVSQEVLGVAEMLEPQGLQALRATHLRRQELERAWRAYCEVGGFPAAVEDYLAAGSVQTETVEMLWDIIAGDIRDLGRSGVSTLKLLERINRSLGTPLSWESLAGDMDVDRTTAREYVELLAESFLLLMLYRWETSGRGLSPRRQRKVYFADPLVGRVGTHLLPGSRPSPRSAVREELIAIGLYRSATDRLLQAEPAPGSLCFWKSGRGTEIDFLVRQSPEGSEGRFPIEVKGDSTSQIANARKSMGAAFGRGLVITESHLDLEHRIPAVPAPVFLALLPERVERKPVSL
jgi:hypothetical protein